MDVSWHDVRQALVDLGGLRFGEMRVEDAIREIVQTTHSMFQVDGAGLMLADTDQHLRSVAASDERFSYLEDLQVRHQEGPCIEAFDTKELIGVEDLGQDGRWPLFSDAAVAQQVRAVLASPLPYTVRRAGRLARICVLLNMPHTGRAVTKPPRTPRPVVTSMLVPASSPGYPGTAPPDSSRP